MKSKLLFPALIALFSVSLADIASAAPLVIPLQSRANDMAAAYLGGGAFKTGDTFNPLSLGNINTLPTRQLGLLKFDISTVATEPASEVKLSLQVNYLIDQTPNHDFPTQNINIYALNYDLTSAAFTVADINTTNVTLIGSVVVSSEGLISVDLTSGFAAAQAAGFDYFSLRLENSTVLNGPFGAAAYVGIGVTSPMLEVTAVPEPSIYALLGIALFALVGLAKRRGLNEIGK